MQRTSYDTRSLFSSYNYSKVRFFGSDALRKGIEFFHVLEHENHFKAIEVFSLRKKTENGMVKDHTFLFCLCKTKCIQFWSGQTEPN